MKAASRKIKENDMMKFFAEAESYSDSQLREVVTKLISEARAPNQSILRKIPTMNKNQLMKVASDFYLKGSGLGVR